MPAGELLGLSENEGQQIVDGRGEVPQSTVNTYEQSQRKRELSSEQLLKERGVEVSPDDHRSATEIVAALDLARLSSGSLVLVGIEETGTFTERDLSAMEQEGLVIQPAAFGQAVYRRADI